LLHDASAEKARAARDAGASEVVLWGDGSPTREFLYVEDCARGIVNAAEQYDGPEPVNLGSGMEISMRDLAALIARHVGFPGKIIWDSAKPNGQPRRCLDVSRAKAQFGWQAEVAFDEGLRRTITWWESQQR
ncbi:MAG TPA: GDP-mannose 4,6-dehydratase, partial [Novimethylophilus sp.]|uniref:GDP-mannose 4,6-dehydratase n=1 Tax=Novimethylophilus sp. TaxID=2137426 RepID=UPI002F427454